jgi:hypothetical protein
MDDTFNYIPSDQQKAIKSSFEKIKSAELAGNSPKTSKWMWFLIIVLLIIGGICITNMYWGCFPQLAELANPLVDYVKAITLEKLKSFFTSIWIYCEKAFAKLF